MSDVEMNEPSEAFIQCWQAAGQHLQSCMQGANKNWLKADLKPPFLEHLSFRIGNQLFYVRIVDVDQQTHGPGNENGLHSIAIGCQGHACLMPMRKRGQEWRPDSPGWGLINPDTRHAIDPAALVTDEKIEMTDWELHDFAVQIVRDHIVQKLDYQLMSSQGNPSVDPSIWFVGDRGPEWVIVREVRYPDREAAIPANIKKITADCSRVSQTGHFASISCASGDDAFDPSGEIPSTPLWRGHELVANFQGLVPAEQH